MLSPLRCGLLLAGALVTPQCDARVLVLVEVKRFFTTFALWGTVSLGHNAMGQEVNRAEFLMRRTSWGRTSLGQYPWGRKSRGRRLVGQDIVEQNFVCQDITEAMSLGQEVSAVGLEFLEQEVGNNRCQTSLPVFEPFFQISILATLQAVVLSK